MAAEGSSAERMLGTKLRFKVKFEWAAHCLSYPRACRASIAAGGPSTASCAAHHAPTGLKAAALAPDLEDGESSFLQVLVEEFSRVDAWAVQQYEECAEVLTCAEAAAGAAGLAHSGWAGPGTGSGGAAAALTASEGSAIVDVSALASCRFVCERVLQQVRELAAFVALNLRGFACAIREHANAQGGSVLADAEHTAQACVLAVEQAAGMGTLQRYSLPAAEAWCEEVLQACKSAKKPSRLGVAGALARLRSGTWTVPPHQASALLHSVAAVGHAGQLEDLAYLGRTLLHLVNAFGLNALETAAVHGNASTVAAITRMAPELSRSGRYDALSIASATGQVEALRSMLAAGATQAASEGSAQSPLHMAAVHGQVACLRALLQHLDTSLEAVDMDTGSPGERVQRVWAALSGTLFAAHAAQRPDSLDADAFEGMLLEDDVLWCAVHGAADAGQADVLGELLDWLRGVDERCGFSGVAQLGDGSLVGCILRLRVGSHRNTPLHWAAHRGMAQCIGVLGARGAVPWLLNCHGQTSVHLAVLGGHLEALQALLELPDASRCLQATMPGSESRALLPAWAAPWHLATVLAVDGGFVAGLQALLQAGACPLDRDFRGWSALGRSLYRGHTACARVIEAWCLEHGRPLHEEAEVCSPPPSPTARRPRTDTQQTVGSQRREPERGNWCLRVSLGGWQLHEGTPAEPALCLHADGAEDLPKRLFVQLGWSESGQARAAGLGAGRARPVSPQTLRGVLHDTWQQTKHETSAVTPVTLSPRFEVPRATAYFDAPPPPLAPTDTGVHSRVALAQFKCGGSKRIQGKWIAASAQDIARTQDEMDMSVSFDLGCGAVCAGGSLQVRVTTPAGREVATAHLPAAMLWRSSATSGACGGELALPDIPRSEGQTMLTLQAPGQGGQVVGTACIRFLLSGPAQHLQPPASPLITPGLPGPVLVGHRGAGADSAAAPLETAEGSVRRTHVAENSLLSFSAASAAGASFVEFDVQLSSDGVPVVHHDLLVKVPGTSLKVPITALTAAQLMEITGGAKGTAPAGAPVDRADSWDSD
ncbi:GDE1, partial [Symbiodinium sp. KB8]